MPQVTEVPKAQPPIPANAEPIEPDEIDDDDVEGEDDGEVEVESRPSGKTAAPAKARPAAPRQSTPIRELRRSDDDSLVDFIRGFGGDVPVRVDLYRQSPATFDGVPIKGLLAKYDEELTEEDVQQEHGGGKYQIKIMRQNEKGGYSYVTARTFTIAGNPKVDRFKPSIPEAATASGDDEAASSQVMAMARDLVRAAQERADRIEARSGTDWNAVNAIIKPLEAQLETLSAQLEAKENRIHELATRKPDRSNEERLFSALENKEAGYANSLQQIRIQHDSELRQLREGHRDDMSRRESRFEKELESIRAAHEREIMSLRDAHRQALEAHKLGYENRILALTETIDRLKGDISEKRGELGELRAKKDVGIVEQIERFASVKTALESLSPASEENSKPTWMQFAESVLGSPKVADITTRMMGSAPPAPAEPEDPIVDVQMPDGTVTRMPLSTVQALQARAAARQAAAAQAQGGAGAAGAPKPPDVDPKTVQRAVTYIEAAIRNHTDPKVFAVSAESSIPKPILRYVAQHGIDAFVNNVANLEPGSPIDTVAGRKFVAAVAAHLLGNTTEGTKETSSPVDG